MKRWLILNHGNGPQKERASGSGDAKMTNRLIFPNIHHHGHVQPHVYDTRLYHDAQSFKSHRQVRREGWNVQHGDISQVHRNLSISSDQGIPSELPRSGS